jgi:threonine/homoserine/homoserine lactone efflux protein
VFHIPSAPIRIDGDTAPMLDSFLHGILAGYGVAIPVGAIAVLIVGVGIRCGFACGASAGAGAATADGIYATVAGTVGTAAAAVLEPWATPIRWVSGFVLIAPWLSSALVEGAVR